jgi:Tfp pilus assembly protein PilO
MQIVGPIIGFGAIIMFASAGVVMVRVLTARFARPDAQRALDPTERARLDDMQHRLGELEQLTQRMSELEERLDFTERILAKQREQPRLEPPPE